MTAYLVTDADLTALSAYRGPALVGDANRVKKCWNCRRFGRKWTTTDAGEGLSLPEAIAFLRTTCQADTIRAESSFKLPADPPIVVAFRPRGKLVDVEAALRVVRGHADAHGLRCVGGGVETPERQGVTA